MKVYFNQQIWFLLSEEVLDVRVIEKAMEKSDCHYNLSVNHLEELHNTEIKETKEKG